MIHQVKLLDTRSMRKYQKPFKKKIKLTLTLFVKPAVTSTKLANEVLKGAENTYMLIILTFR